MAAGIGHAACADDVKPDKRGAGRQVNSSAFPPDGGLSCVLLALVISLVACQSSFLLPRFLLVQ